MIFKNLHTSPKISNVLETMINEYKRTLLYKQPQLYIIYFFRIQCVVKLYSNRSKNL